MRFCFNVTRFLLLVASCALIAQRLEWCYLEEIGVSSGWAAEMNQSDGFPAFYLPEGRPCGDTFPIYKDGAWHLFCLRMPGFGHFVTRDLVHWENRPFIPFGDCTGTVVEHQGKYYLFYTHHQQIWLATSNDLDNWALHPGNPLLVGDGKKYAVDYFRDPYVMFHKDEGVWWMLLGSQYVENRKPGAPTGCVGLAKSKDLLHWTLVDPLWAPGLTAHCDCPQLIAQDNRWYLAYLHTNTRYRVADSINGPWQRPPIRDLGTMWGMAGSRPAFDGQRWISWAFLAKNSAPQDLAGIGYGGTLCVPREWTFQKDGGITQRVPDEVIAAIHAQSSGNRNPLEGAVPLVGRWQILEGEDAKSLDPTGGILRLADTPENFYFEADMTLDTIDMEAHVLLNYHNDRFDCYSVSFSPRENVVRLRGTGPIDQTLETIPFPIDIRRPIKLRVFRSGLALEVFIDEKTVLTRRVYQHRGGNLALEFRDGLGSFTNQRICCLATLKD